MLLQIPYESEKAVEIDRKIFEHMYYGALEASMELAKINGPYDSY